MFAQLSGTATKQGQAEAAAYVRRVAGASGPTTASLQFEFGGLSGTSSTIISDAWARLDGGPVNVQSGTAVLLRVGLSDAAPGDCLVIDDATVAVP